MSIQAVAWAIEQQEVTDPATRFVLVCLANYAGADGRSAFPSVLRLSRDTGLCERAVQYQLRRLIKAMLIQRGNQAIAAANISRGDRRPTCYDLMMSRGAPHAPRESTGCTTTSNGVHMDASRGAPHAPDPSPRSVREPKRRFANGDLKTENQKRADFERLYKTLAQRKKV
jgi:hypothetical protein